MPMSEPVTLGEVDRNVQRLREEVREGLNNVSQRMDRALDGTLSSQVYASDKNAWEYRLSDVEKEVRITKEELAKKEEISRGQKNILTIGLVFPTLILILNTAINFYFKVNSK